MSKTDQFDEALAGLVNKERMEDYGHPLDHFSKTAAFAGQINGCPDPQLRHALYMISDKIARLCNSPEHLDSWIDIAGYARTAVMILDERERRGIGRNA